jgi:AraC-like DNA-binding protein
MLINEYRINEVLRLFAENHHNRYTMEAISKQVGFGSRASFNAVFKKVTGVTPTFYIKNL